MNVNKYVNFIVKSFTSKRGNKVSALYIELEDNLVFVGFINPKTYEKLESVNNK